MTIKTPAAFICDILCLPNKWRLKLEVENDIDEALKNNLFNTSSYLFEEPENLLKQELREPAVYNSIITAIAGGASRS